MEAGLGLGGIALKHNLRPAARRRHVLDRDALGRLAQLKLDLVEEREGAPFHLNPGRSAGRDLDRGVADDS